MDGKEWMREENWVGKRTHTYPCSTDFIRCTRFQLYKCITPPLSVEIYLNLYITYIYIIYNIGIMIGIINIRLVLHAEL